MDGGSGPSLQTMRACPRISWLRLKRWFPDTPEAVCMRARAFSVVAMANVNAGSPGMLNLLPCEGQSRGLENGPFGVPTAPPFADS